MSGDFERELTRRAWSDDAFAAKLESDAAATLASMGVDILLPALSSR